MYYCSSKLITYNFIHAITYKFMNAIVSVCMMNYVDTRYLLFFLPLNLMSSQRTKNLDIHCDLFSYQLSYIILKIYTNFYGISHRNILFCVVRNFENSLRPSSKIICHIYYFLYLPTVFMSVAILSNDFQSVFYFAHRIKCNLGILRVTFFYTWCLTFLLCLEILILSWSTNFFCYFFDYDMYSHILYESYLQYILIYHNTIMNYLVIRQYLYLATDEFQYFFMFLVLNLT